MKKSGKRYAHRAVTLLLPALLCLSALQGCAKTVILPPSDSAQECKVPSPPQSITDGSAADFIDMLIEGIEKCRALLGEKP